MEIGVALARVQEAADDGRLAKLCARHGVALITVFGSAVRDPVGAADLDIAVLFRHTFARDLRGLIGELIDVAGIDEVDLMVVNDASSEARFNGLVGAIPLYEDEPGRWAFTQMAAATDIFDSAWLRRAELTGMAGT